MTTAREQANRAQRRASNPAVSAFVSASAGSGKTKLLTDRLLRLMLTGAEPGRIQCLTFTRAAAAEMAVRLQSVLGAWVAMDDTALDARLHALDFTPDPALRARARALFATVLDQPGGMRIGTIHAFCQSLLRRFPIEARLSPHFRLVEEADASQALGEAREAMLASAYEPTLRDSLVALAGTVGLGDFAQLIDRLRGHPGRLEAVMALAPEALEPALCDALGVPAADAAALLAEAVVLPDEPAIRRALGTIATAGSPKFQASATALLAWLELPTDGRAEAWAAWCDGFFKKDGDPREQFCNPVLARERPDLPTLLRAEQDRLLAIRDTLRSRRAAAMTAALLRLAIPVVRLYAGRKNGTGLLDYDDLIRETGRLLVDPGAAWVLYKLDGGLDHLLLDEVQDTAPAQWDIAGALTAEFFTGEGAREAGRTVFAVGDRKQSIFSFQGADPAEFDRWNRRLGGRVTEAGAHWEDVPLDVSFRSTAPVLALVDAVFADPTAAAGVGSVTHVADRVGQAGRVELWPLAPRPDTEEAPPWDLPDGNVTASSGDQRLAERIAGWIAEHCGQDILPGSGRAMTPGDVLVLVRRRTRFGPALVRALKARGVPVAGLDRMLLTDQPAVADLLALCEALLLPEDDLALACLLTSPLGGVGDDSLMDLAAGRTGNLWQALRERAAERPDWAAAEAFFSALLARTDYATPYALLSEALGPLGGRARLLRRLGSEAIEPVGELLAKALAHASTHAASLQGFVHWLRQSGAEVKREAEAAQGDGGGMVRLMTVHSAKGLEAPVVILPDTAALPTDREPLDWTESGLPVWSPRSAERSVAIEALHEAARQRRREEYNRLLYVALTRPRDRLVVCGWLTAKKEPEGTWHQLVRQGMERLGAIALPFDGGEGWTGEMLVHECKQTAPPDIRPIAGPAPEAAPLPAWTGAAPSRIAAPPPAEPAIAHPLAPSRPDNAALGPTPPAASPLTAAPDARFRRGQLIHTLLQHLPDLPEADRAPALARHLAQPGLGLTPPEAAALAREVETVLAHPALGPLFGPGSRAEVPLTGLVDGSIIGGLVDRLAILPGQILVADYKTNRAPPSTVDETPVLYLRQMAAYRAVLRAAFPGHAVSCTLVWTVGATAMPLPDSLLDRHAPTASPPA